MAAAFSFRYHNFGEVVCGIYVGGVALVPSALMDRTCCCVVDILLPPLG
jgi:hypothetical protein